MAAASKLETSFSYQVADPADDADDVSLIGGGSTRLAAAAPSANGDGHVRTSFGPLRGVHGWLQRTTLGGWPLAALVKPAVTVLVPLVLLPLALGTQPAKAAYAVAVVAIFWVTEVAPLPVVSLIPFLLLPMLGVVTARDAAQAYISDVSFLCLGGFLLAIAIESWNLHERIALRILLFVGGRPSTLLLGFMMITALLSMWISNTASTAMMLPIGQAVLDELSIGSAAAGKADDGRRAESSPAASADDSTLDRAPGERSDDELAHPSASATCAAVDAGEMSPAERQLSTKEVKMRKALALSVAYGASCGGVATLTGTPANLVLAALVKSLFPDSGGVISFGRWMAVGVPTTIVVLFLAWLWLTLVFDFHGSLPVRVFKFVFMGKRRGHHDIDSSELEATERVQKFIRTRYNGLGPLKFAEMVVMAAFGPFVLLLFFRNPGFMSGWYEAFPTVREGVGYVSDGTGAVFVTTILFFLPASWPFPRSQYTTYGTGQHRILDWDVVQRKMPWGIILLLGAGLCLAKGTVDSGLSCWFGNQLSSLGDLDVSLVVFVTVVFITFFTEIVSNTATATIFLPILAQLAVTTLHVNPLTLMIPATVACSFAFMLPAATPPNAIAFSYGHLKVIDMVKVGFAMNLIAIVAVMFLTTTLYGAVFTLSSVPQWALGLSGTSTCSGNLSNATNATGIP